MSKIPFIYDYSFQEELDYRAISKRFERFLINLRCTACPYFQLKFDMRWVMWVLTSNNADLLPAPLLSRCPPLCLGPLTVHDLNGFACQQGLKRNLPDEGVAAIIEVIASIGPDVSRLSLRTVVRMLDDLEMHLQKPILH